MAGAKTLINTLRQYREWFSLPPAAKAAVRSDRNGNNGSDPGIDRCVSEALAWLGRAQDGSPTADGGVARHFSVIDGWGASYPETTGYIIPTLLDWSRSSGESEYRDRARRMLDWLLAIQLDDGAFQGGTTTDRPVAPVVFNTGQILMGLAAGSKEFGEPYTSSMHRAAKWLVDNQDQDGNWRRGQSPFAKSGDKAYDTHTSWGLLEAARASGEQLYADSALRNVHWALTKQKNNGWFADCCLTDPANPLTHTIGYTLKGVIEAYLYSDDPELLQAAERTATALLDVVDADGAIAGRLDSDWRPAVPWVCMTGSAQIAECWLQLAERTANSRYLKAAKLVNRYLRRSVKLDASEGERGAIRGSFPIDGEYGQYQYLNWAAKFFIDANLAEKRQN